MSALDFANSFAQALQPTQPTAHKVAQPTTIQQNQKTKKKFKHSPNVIIKHGTYKGYYGFVQRYEPGIFEVQFQEEQNVPVAQYGIQPIGSTILTYFGNSTIVNKIDVLYGIKVNSAAKSEMFFNANQLTKIVIFKDNGTDRFGQFLQSNNKDCEVSVYETNSLDELAQMYRSNDVPMSGNKQTIDCSQIVSELFFVSSPPTRPSDTNYIGLYGPLTRIVPEQYVITYTKTVYKTNKAIVTLDKKNPKVGSVVTIKNGPYRGKQGIVINEEPPRLAVFIDAVGRAIQSHIVKQGDQYKEKPITPDDVFYMDILLKETNDPETSGKYVQVVSVVDQDNIIGIIKGSDYIPKKIPLELIESYQPGFSFDTKHSEPEEPQPEDIFVNEEKEETDETEDTDDTDNPEYDYDGQEEERYIDEDESKYKSSYKDAERTAFTETKLTNAQNEIKTTINTIVNAGGFDVNVYTLITNVESAFEHIKRKVSSIKQNGKYWKKSDEKYIIACLVLYSVIQAGYTHALVSHEGDRIGNYIRQLQTHKLFHKKDISGSIFLINGWSDEFTVDVETVQALHSSRNFENIYRIMFENCNAVLQPLFGPVALNSNFNMDNLRLIPLNTKPKEPVKLFVTVADYLAGNIPSSAKNILFGYAYQDIIEKYKRTLADAVNNNTSSASKKVYGYILENVERMPFALKELHAEHTSQPHKLTKLKYKKMLEIWKMLLDEIKARFQNHQQYLESKREIRLKVEEEREKVRKRRAEIFEQNSLAGHLEELNLDDEPIVKTKESVQDLSNKYKKLTTSINRNYAQEKRQRREAQEENSDNTTDNTNDIDSDLFQEMEQAMDEIKM